VSYCQEAASFAFLNAFVVGISCFVWLFCLCVLFCFVLFCSDDDDFCWCCFKVSDDRLVCSFKKVYEFCLLLTRPRNNLTKNSCFFFFFFGFSNGFG